MLKPLLADNNTVISSSRIRSGLRPLRTDEGKVSQIVRNLISNALKFTPDGKVSVCARAPVMTGCCSRSPIPASAFPRSITRRFFRSSARSRIRCRNGIAALAWDCRSAATWLSFGRHAYGWKAPLVKGSTFFVEIPTVYIGDAAQDIDRPALPAVPEFHRAPVLIVEDNPQTASLLESYLRNSEFQAIVAADVSQAQSWSSRHSPIA